VRRAVSRPVCADETNPALSVDRKFRGASTVGPHTAQPAPAVAPHDPPRQADACRSAIGRPILPVYLNSYTRWKFNYVRAFLEDKRAGNSLTDAYGMRFDYDF